MAIVYRHRKADTLEVFYVGIGTNLKRAYRKDGRSDFWNKIVRKHGFFVEILYQDVSWEDACEVEQFLISEYGRINLGTGCLCNMTDGGEGTPNRVVSSESYNNHRKSVLKYTLDGNFLEEFDSQMSASISTGINNSKISAVCRGERKSAGGYIWRYKEENFTKKIKVDKFRTSFSRPVLQYSKEGDFIAEFHSLGKAGKFFGAPNGTSIKAVCDGHRNTAYGYIWKYK